MIYYVKNKEFITFISFIFLFFTLLMVTGIIHLWCETPHNLNLSNVISFSALLSFILLPTIIAFFVVLFLLCIQSKHKYAIAPCLILLLSPLIMLVEEFVRFYFFSSMNETFFFAISTALPCLIASIVILLRKLNLWPYFLLIFFMGIIQFAIIIMLPSP